MRYLIVKLAALGDVVMTSALVGELRRRDADAHVTWLCGRGAATLVRLFDGVDEVLEVDEAALLRGNTAARVRALSGVWRMLARRRFDRTFLAHADKRYRLLILPVRTGHVRAFEHALSSWTLPIPGRYVGDETVRLLDDEPSQGPIRGHYPLADVRHRLGTCESDGDVGVVLVPGGARNILREDALRRWPVGHYRVLAQRLLLKGYRVTLVGDVADAWVRPTFAGLDVRDEIGTRDLPGTLRILSVARVVVVHDTGVLHLTRLVRVPVIGLFGPTIPSKSLTDAADVVTLWGGSDLACRPCYNGREYAACRDNICMSGIPVDVVEMHVDQLAAPRRSTPVAQPREQQAAPDLATNSPVIR
jgi:heptosyltransferase-2